MKNILTKRALKLDDKFMISRTNKGAARKAKMYSVLLGFDFLGTDLVLEKSLLIMSYISNFY